MIEIIGLFRRVVYPVALVFVMMSAAIAAKRAPAPPSGMVNLSRGEPYSITPLFSTKYSFSAPSFNPSEGTYHNSGQLTDGLLGSSTKYNDGQWQGYARGGARTIILDMGRVNTVEQIQERFIQIAESDIYFPRRVTYSLSMNDSDWAVVGTVNSAVPPTSNTISTQTYKLSHLDDEARYVKMTFPVDIWVFADEFQVFGKKGIAVGAVVPRAIRAQRRVYTNAYCPPGSPEVGGTRDMVLIPNGYYKSKPSLGEISVDQLIPYVGYETRSGKITDFMFDAFLFTPFGNAPSGGVYGANLKKPTVLSDWTYYLNNTFNPQYNLSALNIATEKVKQILRKPDYKTKVEIAIPFPTPSATNFGDINGDGHSENLSNLSDRENVVKWYINQVMTRWNRAHFTNLKLVGFYWLQEQWFFVEGKKETALLRYTGHYVRSLGKVLNWIPFYQADGIEHWHSLGFDGAWLQPNYCFSTFPVQELGEAANLSKKLGMGIEIEIHWDALTNDTLRAKYYSYLNWGLKKGYMTQAAHAYYQNAGPGTFFQSCMSKNPAIREVYDKTYEFIKGTYTRTSVTR